MLVHFSSLELLAPGYCNVSVAGNFATVANLQFSEFEQSVASCRFELLWQSAPVCTHESGHPSLFADRFFTHQLTACAIRVPVASHHIVAIIILLAVFHYGVLVTA